MAQPGASEAPPPAQAPHRGWTEHEVELLLGRLLQVGVAISAAVVLAGGAVYLVRHGGARPHYGRFVGEPAELRSVTGILHAAAAGRGRAVIQLGLLLLLATPVVFWCAWPFHRAAAVNARHLASTMDTLVSLGVLAAWGYSVVELLQGGMHLYF